MNIGDRVYLFDGIQSRFGLLVDQLENGDYVVYCRNWNLIQVTSDKHIAATQDVFEKIRTLIASGAIKVNSDHSHVFTECFGFDSRKPEGEHPNAWMERLTEKAE